MSDEDLRELKREARANPDDAGLGHGLARAFERAGDRRGAYHELCRVARLGDRDALERVLAWSPWPSADGAGRTRRARRTRITTRPEAALARLRSESRLLVGGDAAVFALEGNRPAAYGPDLAPLWSYAGEDLVDPRLPPPTLFAHGEDLLFVAGKRLLLFDGRRGVVRAEASLPAVARRAAAQGDVLLVVAHEEREDRPVVLAIDIGPRLGEPLWVLDDPRRVYRDALIGGSIAWVSFAGPGADPHSSGPGEGIAAHELVRGTDVRIHGLPRPGSGAHDLVAADEAALLVHAHESGELLLIGDDGVRWSIEVERLGIERLDATALGATQCALGPHEVVLCGWSDDVLRVTCLERDDGATRWSMEHHVAGARSIAIADGAVYVATATRDIEVAIHDLADGRPRLRSKLGPLTFALTPPRSLSLLALERALLLEVRMLDPPSGHRGGVWEEG